MTQEMTAFAAATEQVYLQIEKMADMEQEKRQALLKGDVETIDRAVQQQQAMIMNLQNLENRRITAQDKTDLKGMTIATILNKLSPQDKAEFEPLFDKLRFITTELKHLNKLSLDLADMELRLLAPVSSAPSADGLYGADGRKSSSQSSGFSFSEKF